MSNQYPPEPFPLPPPKPRAKEIQCQECGGDIKNDTYTVRRGVIYCDSCAKS